MQTFTRAQIRNGTGFEKGVRFVLIDESIQRALRSLEIDKERDDKDTALQAIGESAAQSIAEMVAALECDYDRLEELREHRTEWIAENPGKFIDPNDTRTNYALACPDEAEELAELVGAAGESYEPNATADTNRDNARQHIEEDALSIEIRSGWYTPGEEFEPEEFCILLSTGAPATRIIGELDEHRQPSRARLQAQDWFTPWTDYRGDAISSDDLLTYCQQFYFGE
jgi:hypothetical protein